MTMMRNNLTLCLFTSTLGHFGRTDIYRQTVTSLLSQVPGDSWGAKLAHIKSSGSASEAEEMGRWLNSQEFAVMVGEGGWKHGDQSHQTGFLADMWSLINWVQTPYFVLEEDDWAWQAYDHEVEYWLHEAVTMLDEDPELVQVRIARYSNEAARIKGLKAKHGIDASVYEGRMPHSFRHSDYSNNPSIFRTRDFRAALRIMKLRPDAIPNHSEHGLGMALKTLSSSQTPFACFNPERIRCGHLGVARPEEADDLSKPLLAS